MDEDVVDLVSEQNWEQAKAALMESPIFNLRHLDISQSGNSLILTGRVHSFYEKQQAQELIRDVIGTCELVNSIDVHSEGDRPK